MNPNWPKWIFSSLSKFFATACNGYNIYIEGTDQQYDNTLSHLEFRLDGPFIKQITKKEFIISVVINILIAAKRSGSDFHEYQRYAGIALGAVPVSIDVFDFSTDPDTVIGCLQRQDTTRNPTEINNFGQIDKDIPLEHGTVTAHYSMILET